MMGLGTWLQIDAARTHLHKTGQCVNDLLLSTLSSQSLDDAKREKSLKAATDLLDFAERHAGKPESDFELRFTEARQIAPVREIINLITARKSVSGDQVLAAQDFFFKLSEGFSVRMRMRGGCRYGLPFP